MAVSIFKEKGKVHLNCCRVDLLSRSQSCCYFEQQYVEMTSKNVLGIRTSTYLITCCSFGSEIHQQLLKYLTKNHAQVCACPLSVILRPHAWVTASFPDRQKALFSSQTRVRVPLTFNTHRQRQSGWMRVCQWAPCLIFTLSIINYYTWDNS